MSVECRVPACDRPELLRRALRSLAEQTHKEWKAVVLDDSRKQSARPVVESFNDSRIQYRHNERQLGATGNLNRAFSPESMLGGEFAFILEDDNALTPEFIEVALLHMSSRKFNVISLNQRCVVRNAGGEFSPCAQALRSEEHDLVWSKERLVLASFLNSPLPNGAYCWRCRTVDLRVDERITEPMLQESARHLRIGGPILLAKEACSLWSALPTDMLRRNPVGNRVFRVTRDMLAVGVLRCIGGDVLIKWGQQLLDAEDLAFYERRLAGVSYASASLWRCGAVKPGEAFKGLALRLVYGRRVKESLRRLLLNEPKTLFA